jgi:tRNA dimethylallyltransferase
MADTLVITGPTASGKTAVAVAVAERLAGEVISMDSRQVYRGMDIGTAKPSMAERRGIPHHGFDLVDPDQRFNAGAFARFARDVMSDIRARGRIPILAGGTGFFLRALTRPLFTEPPLDEAHKEQWKRRLAGFETEELQRWAAVLDAPAARRYRDRQRLARVIEVAVLTGRPLSWWQQQSAGEVAAIDPGVFVLDLPRETLTARIEARVDTMIATGLVDEVRALLAAGYDERSPGMSATGYIELIPWIRGEYSLQQAIELIRSATRQYARRQRTWLRHQLPANAVRLDAVAPADELADRIAALWRAESM